MNDVNPDKSKHAAPVHPFQVGKAQSCLDFASVLQKIIDTIPQTVFWKDQDLIYRGCNNLFAEIAGISDPEELVGLSDYDLPWTREEAEFYRECDRGVMESGVPQIGIIESQVNSDGEKTWLETNKVPLHNEAGEVVGILGTYSDITELKRAKEELQKSNDELERRVEKRTRQLQFASNHDGLTGLLNRSSFDKQLSEVLAANSAKSIALLFLDLDNFKRLNDAAGHESGDRLLIQLASILREVSRSNGDSVAARMGGDEFLLLLTDKTEDELAVIGEEIRRRISYLSDFDDYQNLVTASIGIVHCVPGDYRESEDLINDADIAMYAAKRNGKNSFCFFSSEVRESAEMEVNIEREVRVGVEKKQFVLHYQPIVCVKENRVCGFEALVRWQHPQKGLLFPDSFIAVAESSGAIVPLGGEIIELACSQLASWQQKFSDLGPNFKINVNVSPRQLLEADFVETLIETVSRHKVAPYNIGIEITESLLICDHQEAIRLLLKIREAGFHLSLDDFGTGYSSLNYLDDLPVDTLKIDRSFITKLGRDLGDPTIVRMIVALAKTLDIGVVAEGVEDAVQLQCLEAMGCRLIQGYYFSKPLSVTDAESYLASGNLIFDAERV